MNTGMPKGRAIRTPALGSRDPPSGVLPATRRCYVLEPDNRCPVRHARYRFRGHARAAAWAVTVTVEGRRLSHLPAAVPVPGDRPAARAAEPGRGPRHAGARGAGAALRPGRGGPDAGCGARTDRARVVPDAGGRTGTGHTVRGRRRACPVA